LGIWSAFCGGGVGTRHLMLHSGAKSARHCATSC
jgi:hypothetical protein